MGLFDSWEKIGNTALDLTPVGWASRVTTGKGAVTTGKDLLNGGGLASTVGSKVAQTNHPAYQLGGDPEFAKREQAKLAAAATAANARVAPTAAQTYGNVAPWQQGVLGQAMGANAAAQNMGASAGQLGRSTAALANPAARLGANADALTLQAAQRGEGQGLTGNAGVRMLNMSNEGAGQGLVGAAGNQLMALGQQPAGPSLAEMAMARQGEAAMRQQAAMAAGARGGNAALALQGAAQGQGQIAADVSANLGMQRAAEDLSNRQFQAQALQGAAGIYGAQQAQQANLLGGAANIFSGQNANQLGFANAANNSYQAQAGVLGNQAALYGSQGGLYGSQGGLMNQTGGLLAGQGALTSQQDQAAAALALQQQQANDAYSIALQGQGYGLVGQQANLLSEEDKVRMGALQAKQQSDNQLKGEIIKGAASAFGGGG